MIVDRAMRLERHRSSLAGWSSRTASFAIMLLIISCVSHGFGLLQTIPFFWSLAIVGGLAALAFLAGVGALWRMWQYGLTGLSAASWGVFASLLLLLPYGLAVALYVTRPALRDVTTDVVSPPGFILATQLRDEVMNPIEPLSQAAGLQHMESYPELTGRRYEQSREHVLNAVLTLVQGRGWSPLTPAPVDEAEGTIVTMTLEATATAFLVGIPFDVAIRIEDRGDATFVDMRSVSRYGPHDLGMNALQIRWFLNDLDQALSEIGS